MAGQNSRTVTLTLDAQANGTDSVVKLASELEKLAKKGGDAAPEFQRIANELDSIAKQQNVVTVFNQTTEAVSNASAAMVAARNAAQAEGEALAQLQAKLATAKDAESTFGVSAQASTTALQESRTAYLNARAAISTYLAEIGGAKSASRDEAAALKEKQQVLREAKAAYDSARASVAALTPAYTALKAESAAAAAELKAQEREFKAADAAAASATAEYQTLVDTLDTVSTAMKSLGVDSGNIVAEQNRITQSMSRLEAEGKRLATAFDAAGTASTTTAQRIEQAFGTLGIKSVSAITAEITRVRNAMIALAGSADVTEADFQRAFSASKAKIAELEKQLQSAKGAAEATGSAFGGMFRQFTAASLVANGIQSVVSALASLVQRVPAVTVEFQTMMRTLTVLTGSTAGAAREFEYLKAVAERTGSDIKGLGDSYIRLSAATKDTALEGAQTKRVFEAVSGAMGMLGASSAETENALMAVSQMVSKGVVSMEEMRQQLGERLPGAFQVTAKELGITVADFNNLISSGKLAADDVLPAMARGLEKVYNTGQQNETLLGKWYAFTNALKQAGNAIGDSGLLDGLLKVGRVGAATFTVLVEGALASVKAIGILTAGVVQGDLSGALAEIAEKFKEVDERAGKIAGRSSSVQKSVADLAAEARKAGQEFVTLSDGTRLATRDIEGASTGFVKFLNDSAKATKSAEDFATSARKAAEYTRSAGEASITAANALGSEADKRQAAQKVAEDNARALDALVIAERKVIEVMDAEAMRRAEAIRDGEATSDAHKKQLVELGEDIQKRRVALEGLQNQAEANRILAESMAVQTAATKDNADRVEELGTMYTQLADAARAAQQAVADGTGTQQAANAAKIEAMKAERLYIDALEDSKARITANLNVKRAQFDLDSAGINLAIQQQNTIYQNARLMGDEYTANQALLKIKEYQIQLMRLTAQMRSAEATAQLAQIEADRAEAAAKGQLTASVQAELKARTLAAQAKALEGKIASETAKQMKDLYDATVAGAGVAVNAAGGFQTLTTSLHGVATAAGQAKAAMSELEQYEATKFSNPVNTGGFLDGGHQAPAPVDVTALLYKRGATIEEAKAAEKYYGELYARNSATMLTGNLGTTENAVKLTRRATNDALDKALAYARIELQTGSSVSLGNSIFDYESQNLANIRYGAGVNGQKAQTKAIKDAGNAAMAQPISITIGGKTKTINAASVNDGAALVEILQQLENDKEKAY